MEIQRIHKILFFLLIAMLIISFIFLFTTQDKRYFAFVIISTISLMFLFISKTKNFIKDPLKNYELFYKTSAGQKSGWPDPVEVGSSMRDDVSLSSRFNMIWRISDVYPLGGYWRYIWLNESGRREYLNLECAPFDWNPLIDSTYNNVIKFKTPRVHPTSPTQEFNADKHSGYNSKIDVKEARKIIKERTGIDPMARPRRKTYAY